MADRKRVLIISHFSDGDEDGGNDRFNYIAKQICNEFDVILLTSSFYHTKKEQRTCKSTANRGFKYEYLFEPDYKKNISLKRFHSHYTFGRNVSSYLKTQPVFDLVYCAVPSLDAAKAAMRYCKEKEVPFIVDIQDLWPEAFRMIVDIAGISDLAFLPMLKTANDIYRAADGIIAVSETYCQRAKAVNKKDIRVESVYLGTDKSEFDQCCTIETSDKSNLGKFKIAYAGTLGHSYNVKIVMDAIKILREQGYRDIEFLVMGDGPLLSAFKAHAETNKLPVTFLGRLPYERMVVELCNCDIAVNPIMKNSAASIINKHGDYAMAGLPVISTQKSDEYTSLLEKYNAGFYCSNEEVLSIVEKIKILYENPRLKKALGENSRKLAEDRFDRSVTYKKIEEVIRSCI